MARVFRNASLLFAAAATATALTCTELAPSPSTRSEHAAAMDTSSGKLLIYGGYEDDYVDDLWEYDLARNNWTELTPSNPKPTARQYYVAAMDTSSRKLLIHGGYGDDYLDDLWEYDLARNSWTDITPSNAKPTARNDHVGAMDTSSRKLLIHGGYGDDFLDDLWEYDLARNSWTELTPSDPKPTARAGHKAAMDTSSRKLLIHGGKGGSYLDDLWEYDLARNSWTELTPSDPKPTARAWHVAAMDTSSGKLLIHGGYGGSKLDDLWEYDLARNNWTELTPSDPKPTARSDHVAAMDTSSGKLLIHGGYDGSHLDDLWEFVMFTTTTTITSTATITNSTTFTTVTATATTTVTVTATLAAQVSAAAAICRPSALFCVASLAIM